MEETCVFRLRITAFSLKGPPHDPVADPVPSPYLPCMENEKPAKPAEPDAKPAPPKEIGGPKGPEPTRYGDWEQKGRCTDF